MCFRGTVFEILEPSERNRIRGFAESLMTTYREDEFKQFFRMSRRSALLFIDEIERVVEQQDCPYLSSRANGGGRPEVCLIFLLDSVK